MLLDAERYASVIEYGKDAVTKINEGNLKEGFESADKGWSAFSESGAKWNQGYGYAKSFFNKSIENNDLVNAKIWLDRMTENNDNLHNFDEELEHMGESMHMKTVSLIRPLKYDIRNSISQENKI